METLCNFLKRHAYPCKYLKICKICPRAFYYTQFRFNFFCERWRTLFTTKSQQWLSPSNLQIFADAIHDKGVSLQNCWQSIDGTVKSIYRPKENQRIMRSGDEKVYVIKRQSVVAHNGLTTNLFGPVQRRSDGSGIMS